MRRRLRRLLPISMACVMTFSSVGSVVYAAEPNAQVLADENADLEQLGIEEEISQQPDSVSEPEISGELSGQDEETSDPQDQAEEETSAEPEPVAEPQDTVNTLADDGEKQTDVNADLEVLANDTKADVSWYQGNGDTFTLTTAGQFAGLAQIVNGYTDENGQNVAADNLNGKTIELGNDIDMTDVVMDPIGIDTSTWNPDSFQGTFDGKGHKISNVNISISKSSSVAGLFGHISAGAQIQNLTVESGTIEATGSYSQSGGIVAFAEKSKVIACTFSGSVSGTQYAGGIVGRTTNGGEIAQCQNTGTVSVKGGSNGYMGGIVGDTNGGTQIRECTNTGKVSPETVYSSDVYAGGICGRAQSQQIKIVYCKNAGEISYANKGTKGYYGGIVGAGTSSGVQVLYCTNSGNVTGPQYTGGIVGQGYTYSAYTHAAHCANSGAVVGSIAGGIGGRNVEMEFCVTSTDKVYGQNSGSHKSVKCYCLAEGTSTTEGVTNCTTEKFTNSTVVNELNASGVPVWKQGTAMPEIDSASVTGLTVELAGADRKYEAIVSNNAFVVEVPADTELAAITGDCFQAETLSAGAAQVYAKADSGEGGQWTLTVTAGDQSRAYTIQVKCASEAWKPEISKDLSTSVVRYQTSSTAAPLSVSANIYDKGVLSYQWYVTTDKKQDGTAIEGATASTYIPPVLKGDGKTNFGNFFYYAVITNTLTLGDKVLKAETKSSLADIRVQYTVQYVDKRGTGSKTENVEYGKKPAFKTLTKPGCEFLGWFIGEEFREDQKWTENSELTDTDITLYAGWEDIHYAITLPKSTDDYTVEAVDPEIKDVLYDGEYTFKVTPKNENAFVLVKSNGAIIKGSDNLYKITDIQEDQEITVEYTEGVEPNEDGEYEVSSEAALIGVLEKNPENLIIKLTDDINLLGSSMSMTEEEAFTGVFDGQGYTISGLRGPLFGWIGETGVVKNLSVDGNLNVYANRVHYGDVIGVGGYYGIADTDADFLGTVAAVNYGTIMNCISTATLDSQKFPDLPTTWGADTSVALGGLVGNNFGTIEACAFKGEIKANAEWPGDASGGIAAQSDGIVRYCYNTGKVAGGIGGGIVGRTNNYWGDEMPQGVVEHCYNAGSVTSQGSAVGGSIVAMTNDYNYKSGSNNHPDREAFRKCLKNNYFLSGTYTSDAGFDGQDYNVTLGMGKTSVMTDDQMKNLEVITGLNTYSETSRFIKDKDNINGGYPILIWEGTPNADDSTVSINFTGAAQAEVDLNTEITTELQDYSMEWLAVDDDGFTVITEKKLIDEEEVDVPFTELTLPVTSPYVGKYLKVRVTDAEDGSSMVSSAQGPVKPAPIKKIYFEENPDPDEDMTAELIYNNIDQVSEHGTISVNVLTDPLQSNSLLDGETISWNSSDESVASVVPVSSNAVYDHEEAAPAAVIEAKGEGSADITVAIGGFSAVVKVTVYPAYVTTQIRMGDSGAYMEMVVQDEDLSEVYGETLAGTPRYITPLHLLTSYVKEILDEDPASTVTVTDGKVTAVDGEEGKWIYVIDGKFGGAIDTSTEVKADSEITFIKLDSDSAVDKAASFDKSAYRAIRTMDLEVALQAAAISGNTLAPLAGASVTARKEGVSDNAVTAVTDAEGKAVLRFQETGEYELTASHTNAEGKNDIVAPYAKVTVADKVSVESIEWVSTDIPQTLEAGSTYQLSAQVKPENANYQGVVYTSDHEDVISVSDNGLLTAKAPGTAKITAASEENPAICKEVSITVVRSVSEIRLEVSEASIKLGGTYQIRASVLPEDATDRTLEYVSNKTSIATVDERGMITGMAPGETTISIAAKDGSDVRAEFTVTVEQPVTNIQMKQTSAAIKIGGTYQIEASVEPANASNQALTFESDKINIAEVDAEGVITGKEAGTAVITVTAADGSGIRASFTVKVEAEIIPVSKVTLNQTKVSLQIGKTYALKAAVSPADATNKTITWSSSNPKVATADNKGKVKAKKAGTAKITAKTANGIKAVCTVTVKKPTVKLNQKSVSVKKGKTNKKVKIKSSSTNLEKIKSAKSSAPKVVKVSVKKGTLVIKGKKKGKAVITVTTTNGATAKVKVTVKK